MAVALHYNSSDVLLLHALALCGYQLSFPIVLWIPN